MKKTLTNYALMMAVASAAMFTSCKSKQKAPKGEIELTVYCTGEQYSTDKKYFRSNAIGESMDQMTSKKKAYSNARAELAANVNLTVKAVIDNYVNSREFNNEEQVEERFESLSREVVEEELSDVRTICEKHTQTASGKYKTYLAIEMSKDNVMEALDERLSKDERLRIDYDYEKFKKTFDAEMEKMQ